MIAGKAYYDQLMLEATTAHQSGELAKAISLYKQLTNDMAGQPEPHHRLALIYAQKGQYQEALSWFEKAIQRYPNHPGYLTNFAETLQRMNQDERAIQSLREALKIDHDLLEAQQKLGTILKKTGAYEAAAKILTGIIDKEPKFYPAFFQLGTLMLETGNYKSAKKYLKSAVKLEPKSVKALNNLAIAYQEWDEYEEAILCYQKALEVDSKYVDSIRNLALVYEKVGLPKKAKSEWLRLANLRQDALIEWKAEILEPAVFQSSEEIDQFRQHVLGQLKLVKTKKINLDADQLTKLDIYPPAGLIYQGKSDLEIKKSYGELFKGIPRANLPVEKNHKPHVGFVVTGGHEGVFVKCMRGLINQLSAEKLDITIICSFPNGEKIVQPAIENPAIKFVSLPKSLGQSVHVLSSLNFDFLHYWEVGTDAYNYFIPYFKPAKIQVTSWGWPTTSGIPTIDYFLSCKGLDEETDQKHYNEKLVLFERLPTYYHPPELPDLDHTRADFGIEENCNLYLCTQNIKKVHPDFDAIVRGILEKDGNARIVFLGDKHQAVNEALDRRLKKSCAPNESRISILERQDKKGYFNVLNLADVILDTLHYNGGANTNADAFVLNKPVVTRPTGFHRGRYTATAYRQMGFEELIADSNEDYVKIATRITNDQDFFNSVQKKIMDTKDQFFEDRRAVSELENFIIECFQNQSSNLAQESPLIKARELVSKNDFISAIRILDQYLEIAPNTALVWLEKGLLHKALHQLQPAFDAMNKARQLDPGHAEILKKFGELLSDLGKCKDAFIAYQKALDINSNDPETLNNFGGLLLENRQYREAIPLLKKSIEIEPDQQPAFTNLGMAYEQLGDIESAQAAFGRIKDQLSEGDLFKLHIETLCPIVAMDQEEIESYQKGVLQTLKKFDDMVPLELSADQLAKGCAFPSFNLSYHGYNVKEINALWGEFYAKRIKPVALGPKNEKPKVGFLVTSGHEGVFMKGGCGLIKQLSSEKFDLFVLMNGEESKQKIKTYIDRDDVSYLSFSKTLPLAIKEIAALNLDFLYYWEVGSDVLNYFLPFYQLGRVQILSWGTPYTSGNPRIQYYWTSRLVETKAYEQDYSEEVVLFDPLVYYYYRMSKPEVTKSREDFGFPKDRTVYLCVQTINKVQPAFDRLLKGILEKDERAVIALSTPNHTAIKDRLRLRFERTIGDNSDRIVFVPKVPHEEYPQRIASADVCIDTPHYAGVNTTYETLQMGTPVISLPGRHQRGKYSEAIYRITGLEAFIPTSDQEYIDMAVELANDPELKKQLIETFNNNAHRLFEQKDIVGEIEAFLLSKFNHIS